MRVKWSERARKQRDEVANYIAGFWDTRMDDENQATQVK